MVKKILLFFLFLSVIVSYIAASFSFQAELQAGKQEYKQETGSSGNERASFAAESFEATRARILSELRLAIDEAVKEGRYKCCIEPACTMCYLGNWIWDDGTCDCDTMIKEGKWDKVCPECKRGIEEGYCKSSLANKCEERTEN